MKTLAVLERECYDSDDCPQMLTCWSPDPKPPGVDKEHFRFQRMNVAQTKVVDWWMSFDNVNYFPEADDAEGLLVLELLSKAYDVMAECGGYNP